MSQACPADAGVKKSVNPGQLSPELMAKLYKKYLLQAGKLAVSFVIIYYFFSRVDLTVYYRTMLATDLPYFFLGLVFYFLVTILQTRKWQVLADMLGSPFTFTGLLRANALSLFSALFLPGGFLAGEAVKSYRLMRGRNDKMRLSASIILDRLTGIVAFIFIGFLAYLIAGPGDSRITAAYLLFFFAAVLIYLVIISPRAEKFGRGLIERWRRRKAGPEPVSSVETAIRRRPVNRAVAYGMSAQLALTAGLHFFLAAGGIYLDMLDLIWISSLLSVATMLPLTFLGIGFREFSLVFLLGQFSIPTVKSLGVATLILVALLIRGLTGGVWLGWGHYKKRTGRSGRPAPTE